MTIKNKKIDVNDLIEKLQKRKKLLKKQRITITSLNSISSNIYKISQLNKLLYLVKKYIRQGFYEVDKDKLLDDIFIIRSDIQHNKGRLSSIRFEEVDHFSSAVERL